MTRAAARPRPRPPPSAPAQRTRSRLSPAPQPCSGSGLHAQPPQQRTPVTVAAAATAAAAAAAATAVAAAAVARASAHSAMRRRRALGGWRARGANRARRPAERRRALPGCGRGPAARGAAHGKRAARRRRRASRITRRCHARARLIAQQTAPGRAAGRPSPTGPRRRLARSARGGLVEGRRRAAAALPRPARPAPPGAPCTQPCVSFASASCADEYAPWAAQGAAVRAGCVASRLRPPALS